jgi:periplasmic copper chaperone A
MKRMILWLGVGSAALCSAAIAEVRVESAWVRAAPPGAPMLAGYGVLHNPGEQPVVVVAASRGAFGAVEIHRTVEIDGMSRMRPAGALEIAPGGSVTLEPGGVHLMLMKPQRALREGDKVTIRLELAGDAPVEAEFELRRTAGEDPHAGHDHDH